VELGPLESWGGAPTDLVLANLLASVLVATARPLTRSTAHHGRLIAGGLLIHEVPTVVGALAAEGFELEELVEHDGWATLALARRAEDQPRGASGSGWREP